MQQFFDFLSKFLELTVPGFRMKARRA